MGGLDSVASEISSRVGSVVDLEGFSTARVSLRLFAAARGGLRLGSERMGWRWFSPTGPSPLPQWFDAMLALGLTMSLLDW